MSGFELVDYTSARWDELVELNRAVWGTSVDEPHFRWWFDGNPVGPRLITLAQDAEGLIGLGAMRFAQVQIGGREQLAAISQDTITHPRARGRGVFQAVVRRNEEEAGKAGASVLLGFANAASAPIFVGPLGWHDVCRPRFWARPLLRRGGRHGLRPAESTSGARGSLSVRPLERFDAEAEALYRRAAECWPDHFLRSAEQHEWRYAGSPNGYRLLGAYGREGLRAFAAVGYAVHHRVPAGVVLDLVAPPGGLAPVRALLRAAARAVDGRALLAMPPPDRAQRAAFVSAGFLPTHVRLRLIAKPLTEDAPSRMYAVPGDTDIF